MPKLLPKTRAARRESILDAGEACFVEKGFHATTMQDICKEAGVSPGALYTYFSSKEDLIAGLSEREQQRWSKELSNLAEAPDPILALAALGEHYCCNEPLEKIRMHVEIGVEASRNQTIARILEAADEQARASFVELLEREKARGRIAPQFPIDTVVRTMIAMSDGLAWHRLLNPSFDARAVLPAMMAMISLLLAPNTTQTLPPPPVSPAGQDNPGDRS